MEVIRLDPNKFLGKSIRVIMRNGVTVRIKVTEIRNQRVNAEWIMVGLDEEMTKIEIRQSEMELVLD